MVANLKNLNDLSVKGGALCLDYVNTIDWRGRTERTDYLADYNDLLKWCLHMGLLNQREATQLNKKAARTPLKARQVFSKAIRIREAIYCVCKAISQGQKIPLPELDIINRRLAPSLATIHIRIHPIRPNGMVLGYADRDQSLDWPLKAVIRSVADILISVEPVRIKSCGNSECGWLFIDKSKNKSRRWCDMADCGNRAKVGRFYRKRNEHRTRLK